MMALAVSALVPLPLLAQGGGQGGQPGRGGMMAARALVEQGSVEFLVSKAAELSIGDAQKAQLQAIATRWAETVKEPREQVKAGMPQAGQPQGGDREAMMARMQTLRPHMQKLVDEDAKALEAAMKLLDDTQRVAAKTLLDERAASMRPRRGGGG